MNMIIVTRISDFRVFMQGNCVLTDSLLLATCHVLPLCVTQVSLEGEHHLPVFPVTVPVAKKNRPK